MALQIDLSALKANYRALAAKAPGARAAAVVKADGYGLGAGLVARALAEGALQVHYQPLLRRPCGTLAGAEALIRWNSPELGLVPPIKFIPLLEETGLILEVGTWALEAAIAERLSDVVIVTRLASAISVTMRSVMRTPPRRSPIAACQTSRITTKGSATFRPRSPTRRKSGPGAA